MYKCFEGVTLENGSITGVKKKVAERLDLVSGEFYWKTLKIKSINNIWNESKFADVHTSFLQRCKSLIES